MFRQWKKSDIWRGVYLEICTEIWPGSKRMQRYGSGSSKAWDFQSSCSLQLHIAAAIAVSHRCCLSIIPDSQTPKHHLCFLLKCAPNDSLAPKDVHVSVFGGVNPPSAADWDSALVLQLNTAPCVSEPHHWMCASHRPVTTTTQSACG